MKTANPHKKLDLVKEVVYQLTLNQKRCIKGGDPDDDGPGTTRTTRTNNIVKDALK